MISVIPLMKIMGNISARAILPVLAAQNISREQDEINLYIPFNSAADSMAGLAHMKTLLGLLNITEEQIILQRTPDNQLFIACDEPTQNWHKIETAVHHLQILTRAFTKISAANRQRKDELKFKVPFIVGEKKTDLELVRTAFIEFALQPAIRAFDHDFPGFQKHCLVSFLTQDELLTAERNLGPFFATNKSHGRRA